MLCNRSRIILTEFNKTGPLIILLGILCIFLYSCFHSKNKRYLTSYQSIEETKKIEKLLSTRSPYMTINNNRVSLSFQGLKKKLRNKDTIDKVEFTSILNSVLGELGDRHFKLKYTGDCNDKQYYLPFSIAPLNENKILALKNNDTLFSFFLKDFPCLKKVDDLDINTYLNDINKYTPKYSKLALGVEKLYEYYKIKPRFNIKNKMKFTFSSMNFKVDTTLYLNVSQSKKKWKDYGNKNKFDIGDKKIRESLFKTYPNNVAYIKIPRMYNLLENRPFFDWLKKTMQKVKQSNALIIDIRNNLGGTRDLINFFGNYFIPPNQFWVANLSKYRGVISDTIKTQFSRRFLFPYDYFKNNTKCKTEIDSFMNSFKTSLKIDDSLLSDYHFMVLKGNIDSEEDYYSKPIYILTNEKTFSAASVFASSFKGLKNIKLAGISTDGSSGLSGKYKLKKSEIEIKISHMLSFQRNGLLFDGNGTKPDIEIKRSLGQILGYEDYQLRELVEIIKEN